MCNSHWSTLIHLISLNHMKYGKIERPFECLNRWIFDGIFLLFERIRSSRQKRYRKITWKFALSGCNKIKFSKRTFHFQSYSLSYLIEEKSKNVISIVVWKVAFVCYRINSTYFANNLENVSPSNSGKKDTEWRRKSAFFFIALWAKQKGRECFVCAKMLSKWQCRFHTNRPKIVIKKYTNTRQSRICWQFHFEIPRMLQSKHECCAG